MIDELKHSVHQLCQFKDRRISHKIVDEIANTLTALLHQADVNVIQQKFKSPIHFIQVLLWLFGGLIGSMILYIYGLQIIGVLLYFLLLLHAYLYFDWRASLLTKLPPLIRTFNFIAKKNDLSQRPSKKIILMAHWDTAPITLPYRTIHIKKLRSSMILGYFFMCAIFIFILIDFIWLGSIIFWLLIIFLGYNLIQIPAIVYDFIKFGYSNGANDNATGCAVAIALANYFWNNIDNCSIELCITGAEEVGMLGSKIYMDSLDTAEKSSTYILNFDTVGCEQLQLISQSGTFTKIKYKNELFELSKAVIKETNDPTIIEEYHTADVDTAWFARANYNCISLISQNSDSIPGFIHRPEDTVDRLDWDTVLQAFGLGKNICEKIIDDGKIRS